VAQQINLEILIDESLKVSPFTSLSVHQQINGHHYFEVRFNQDVKSGKAALSITKFQEYLGKSISITFGGDMYNIMQNHTDKVFKGIISEIVMANTNYEQGNIIVKGYSPTILLETNKNCSFYLKKNLNQIVTKLSEKVPSNVLTFNIKPSNWKQTIPYVVQYNESNFDFIKRLACDYGEWLIYNGKELFFGKPSSLPVVKLSYPEDISDLNLSIRTMPLNYEKSAYSIKKADDKYIAPSSVNVSGLGIYGDDALKKSDNTYLIKTSSPAMMNIVDKSHLDGYVKSKKGADASRLVVLQGNSDNPGVQVGIILDVSSQGSNIGKYLVISAVHSSDGLGNYSNVFEAVPADIEFLPAPVFTRPYIEPQIGKVIDNIDPDKLGRIKVQLMWQKDEDKSSLPWLQNLTSSAGKTGSGKKNRGFHFTPEINDYVIVNFTENDPSKPFVMGSISLDENRESGSNKDNFEKTIRTRSGNTIYFRDKENDKEQEIRIETDEKNYVSILVKNGDGTIEIQSTKDISVTSKKTVNVKSENITIESTKDITIKAQGKIDIKAQGKIDMASNDDVAIEGVNLKLNAKSELKADGATVAVSAKSKASLKANAMLELQASGQTVLKGGIVMIN
jgi:uncharacterized protein involved in type VI secretion and phage assembly